MATKTLLTGRAYIGISCSIGGNVTAKESMNRVVCVVCPRVRKNCAGLMGVCVEGATVVCVYS